MPKRKRLCNPKF